jgi:cytochrome c-type biogenesis protein CcsB
MVFTGDFLTVFPEPDDENNKWHSANEAEMVFDSVDAGFVKNILPLYYGAVTEATNSGDWTSADEYLDYIKLFQEKYGSDIFPPRAKVQLEVYYNKVNIFKRLFPYYALTGLLLLIFLFINVLSQKNRFLLVQRVLIYLIGLGFFLHTIGLGVRWYLGGHAPWSNGYETMIYIAWALLLSGFLFSRRSKIALATTSILASVTLMVANLSWLDPEITNLVPVLKSYWLVIHVAVITASYSFLAIGALLGFLNLILINFQNAGNFQRLKDTIKEITNINEMNLIIGVFLITIGTFLGAVWANESWGRYWGWDPKETWALVTVLVYSFVVHMRMIPGLNGVFAFNFASLISFSSVLMTYFGVNYYLSGLHSYAQGDPVPVPMFVYYAIAILFIVSVMGYVNYRRMQKTGHHY